MLIVNIGDMLDEASQGYYPSTIHRVLNPTGEEAKKSRISLPLFLHPRPDVVLSERHTSGSYLQERLRELGVKIISQYCCAFQGNNALKGSKAADKG
jgi:isopenicillin N synthase-like dioxygenase